MLTKILRQLQNYCISFGNPVLRKCGLALHHSWQADLQSLRIKQVIDIGVAKGTYNLLNAYPDAEYIFIEANPIYHEYITMHLCPKYHGVLIPKAAGSKSEVLELSSESEASSFVRDSSTKSVSVPVEPLDTLLEERIIHSDSLLKIDTEGFEMEVLKGAKNTLTKVTYVCVELRLSGIQTYNPSELITFLYEQNFQWKQTLKVAHRRFGVSYIDIIFERITK